MTRLHVAAALLAFGSLAALPACSTMDGMMGTQTSSAAPMRTQELSPSMVRQVQISLQQQGLYTGSIDGVWGPQTQGAVQSFQQAHGLAATGELNSSTLAALNVPAAGAPIAMQPATAPPADATSSAAPAAPAMAAAVPTDTTSSATPIAPATGAPMPAVATSSTTSTDAPTP